MYTYKVTLMSVNLREFARNSFKNTERRHVYMYNQSRGEQSPFSLRITITFRGYLL